MAKDRVIVDAGGRIFKTTTTTLLSSGSCYFSALLGFTGAALGSLSPSGATEGGSDSNSNEGVAISVAVTPHANGRKRARNDDGSDEDVSGPEVKEIFVDRDPDLFADVLHFMRSARLPARTRQDAARLEDLKAEALFFGYEDLDTACSEALKEIQASIEDALKPEPQPTAECRGFVVPAEMMATLDVPEHQILYVASATLAGNVRSRRYVPTAQQIEKRREREGEDGEDDTSAFAGCYINTCEQSNSGDFQLEANFGDGWISIAHVALDHFRLDMEIGLNVDFRQDIRHCLAPKSSNDPHISLRSRGAGDWHLSCWIGEPSAIPEVGNNLDHSKESMNRRLARSQNALTAAGAATTTAAAAAVATTSMTTMTMMTAAVAMMAAGIGSLRR